MTQPHSASRTARLTAASDREKLADDRVRRLVHEVTDEPLQSIRTSVAAVKALLAKKAPDATPPIDWSGTPDEQYEAVMDAIDVWFADEIEARNPSVAKVFRPCWREHPEALDAVRDCWLAWLGSRADDARRIDPAVWRKDFLSAMRRQVNDVLKEGCEVHG